LLPRRFAVVVVLLSLAAACFSGPKSDHPVFVTVGSMGMVQGKPGDTVAVRLPLTVASGLHVNANPASSEDYIPLEISLRDSFGVRLEKAVYPKGKKWRLEGTTEDLLVYKGKFDVGASLIIDTDAEAGVHMVKGSLEYQACDDHVCFMPDSRPITIKVNVLPPH
jgi:hypothetical protein